MSGSAILSPALPTVASVVAQLLAAEGPYTVAGRFIADEGLTGRERLALAERIVRDAARRAEAPAARCVWCHEAVDAAAVRMAGDPLHPACARELEVELWGAPLGAEAPAFTFAPVDETDGRVIEAETGAGEAWAFANLAGESVAGQRAKFVALGRAA
jgi:hypothetical protein